jgi:hypothetical protein
LELSAVALRILKNIFAAQLRQEQHVTVQSPLIATKNSFAPEAFIRHISYVVLTLTGASDCAVCNPQASGGTKLPAHGTLEKAPGG